jgi:uroporphyrinogen decarboxylase
MKIRSMKTRKRHTMKRNELSHRERVLLALDHKETDRIPIAMVCSSINQPANEMVENILIRERGISLEGYLKPKIDIKEISPSMKGGRWPSPGRDIWGVHRTPVANGAGGFYNEIDHYPLFTAETVGDLSRHVWPSTDWFDYGSLPETVRHMREDEDHSLMVRCGNIFETSWYMRGFENMFMDFLDRPDFAHALMDRVCDFYVEHATKTLSAIPREIDLVFTADDIAGQSGLLMSLEMWEEFIKPRHVRLNKRIHELGSRVIYHSDGAVMEAVPGLIDMGIDVLQALQFDAAGMDPVKLKNEYGDRLCFEGGVSVQKTMPFGTADDVRKEVRRLSSILGKGGGYILGPSHRIQAGTPPENILALFDEAENCCSCF